MIRRPYVALLSCLPLVACAPLPGAREPAPVDASARQPAPPVVVVPPAPPAATPADLAAREVLAFHDHVRQLPPPELGRELARVGDPPATPRATLQFAVLLGLTRNGGDLARALAALDPLLRSTAPEAAAWQPVARLIAARYAEQRRVEEQLERQNQQVRDSQRKLEQLNEKLEALKAIERSLTARPANGSAAPASAPALKATPP